MTWFLHGIQIISNKSSVFGSFPPQSVCMGTHKQRERLKETSMNADDFGIYF